jgi:hypothetical protein
MIDHIYIYIPKHASRYGRVKVQRKELLASTSFLVIVAIARIHHSVIVLHWSQTNTYKRKRGDEVERERKELHTLCCLDKIKREKKEKREATVDVVIPDSIVIDA